jgi:superfamily I DNA/RNA helicase
LTVGDDDQVLYETLKSGKASLIRAIYADGSVVNAMLPFCGRCGYHITCAADHFIKQQLDEEAIEKIYLPISAPDQSQKVHVIACAAPTAAVDYIRKFIEDNRQEIEQRRKDLTEGKAKDAYLLILSPSGAVSFYRPNDAKDELFRLVSGYSTERKEYSEDYYKVLNYYSVAKYPKDNFTFRKVLHYEGQTSADVYPLLEACIPEWKPLSDLDVEVIKSLLKKVAVVRDIIDSKASVNQKVKEIAELISIDDQTLLKRDLDKAAIDQARIDAIEHQEDEDAELEEIEVRQMSAVELMTIVGSKGLSAEHVIIIGFDEANMSWVTRSAFYVAMTRARKSLHLLTALKAGGANCPHDYLNYLPDANLEFAAYKKGERVRVSFGDRMAFRQYLRNLHKIGRRR